MQIFLNQTAEAVAKSFSILNRKLLKAITDHLKTNGYFCYAS